MKTIRQIAEEIGVSKQAIHKKIKKEPLADNLQGLMSTGDNGLQVNVDGEKLIKSAFAKKSTTKSLSTVNHTVDNETLHNIINSLKEQLAVKDSQIESLIAIIKKQSESASGKHKYSIEGRATPNRISVPIDRLLAKAIEHLENKAGGISAINRINNRNKAILR